MTAAMLRTATWTLLGTLLACSGKKEEGTSQAPAAAPQPAAPTTDAATAVAAAADAAPAPPFLPAALDEKSGIVFAAKAGGSVKGIKDGTPVTIVGQDGGAVGDMADAHVTVKYEGKKVKLVADRVLQSNVPDPIHRSPDNRFAVFAPIVACGDLCHSVIWLISATDGKRVKLGEGGPDVYVAWHPKGGTVAVGSASLWIVSLPDFKVKAMDDFRSPSYSPDGTLYVRSGDGSAYTIGKGKPVKVWDSGASAEPDAGPDDEEMDTDEPKPVDFENGKPMFDLDWYPH